MVPATQYLHLLPALCLLGGGLLILFLDLVIGRERVAPWAWGTALVAVLIGLGSTFLFDAGSVQILTVLTYDAFTAYIWRLILITLALIVLLGESYIRNRIQEPGLFYAIMMFFAFAALLLVGCSNTIMLLLTVDMLSIVGYILTGFLHDDKRSTEAATKYMIYGSAVSAVMAFGLSWLYGMTGTADYEQTSQALTGFWAWTAEPITRPGALIPILIFLLAGFSFKIGSAPFHQWLPDAFEGAPAPVAAALAIVPKVAGFAALVRLTMVMLPDTGELGQLWRWPLLAFLSMAAMLIGNLIGLGQTNMKRLVAYSGIAQVGYALIGVAVATEFSLSALLIYLTAYALAEVAAFAAITVISEREGMDLISDYRGLYHRAPVMAVVLLISVLSLFGMPGTGGFIAKLWLFNSTFQDARFALLIVAAFNSVVSMAYYWKIIHAVFVHADEGQDPVRVPGTTVLVFAVTVAGMLALGIYPLPVLHWAEAAVQVFFVAG